MNSNVNDDAPVWVSGVIRPVSHSSEVRRSRKAEKNRKDRQRKQARKQAANTVTVALAASGGDDTAPKVEEQHHQHREHEDADVSSGDTPLLPQKTEVTSEPMTSAAKAKDAEEEGHPARAPKQQAPSAPTTADSVAVEVADMVVPVEVDNIAEVEKQADLDLSQSQPDLSQSQPELVQEQPQESPQSYYVEDNPAHAEQWARARARNTAWARETEAKINVANGQGSGEYHRRFAPPAQQYSLPILSRTAAFAVQCGFGPGVTPQLLHHVVSTVYGEKIANSVTALSSEDVEYMFAVFWNEEIVPVTETERLFRLAASFVGDDGSIGMTMDDLRPLLAGAVQQHPEFLSLTTDNQIRYLENVLATTFCRLGRYGVISLDDLRRSDFVASFNAVGRHEIGLEDSIFFSRFTSLTMGPNPRHQQLPLSPYGQGGTQYGNGVSPYTYTSGVQNAFWASSPPTVAVGSWR